MRKSLWFGSFAFALLAAAGARAATDEQFLADAIQGDNSEMMLGHLAGERGGSAEVKNAGMMIEGDHAKHLIDAKKLADARGMKAPETPSVEASGEAKKLSALSGAQFDKEFSAYMIDDHQKDIAKYKAEAGSGSGQVARFAEMTLPTLQKHLDMAEKLQKSGE